MRDCENCKHHILNDYKNMTYGCESWECKFEPKDSILDKIRAEIEEHAKINQNLNTDRARALCWCLDVIDKHKAESEE